MPTVNPADLNHRFGIPGQLTFRDTPQGMAVAEIRNAHAVATLHLQGAQLTDWTPHGQAPVLWLSKAARFAAGKAIRGGVPVCWPWFGDHPSQPGLPAHGHARTSVWEVIESAGREDGSTCLALRLPQADPSLWPHDTPLELRLTVGKTLEIELLTRNLEATTVSFSQALHAYFHVGDVRRVAIQGLDGCAYLDKLDRQRKRQEGPVGISAETDRIYLESRADCRIDDPSLNRSIRIRKHGSASTIVWNPWADKARQLGDLGEDGHLNMVCVESANAADDVVGLPAGAEHRLWVSYAVEALVPVNP